MIPKANIVRSRVSKFSHSLPCQSSFERVRYMSYIRTDKEKARRDRLQKGLDWYSDRAVPLYCSGVCMGLLALCLIICTYASPLLFSLVLIIYYKLLILYPSPRPASPFQVLYCVDCFWNRSCRGSLCLAARRSSRVAFL